jgi:hypothetical protein
VSVMIRIYVVQLAVAIDDHAMPLTKQASRRGFAYPLNRSKSRKLLLQIMLGSIIAQPRDDQRLERVAPDIGVFVRFDCDRKTC